jgi:copper(I)-binding protein
VLVHVAVFAAMLVLALPAARGDGTAVTVTEVWARATPPGARMGSIYLTLMSAGGDRLLRASVPHAVSPETQIHETVVAHDSNGVERMEMHAVPSIELPANQAVELKPGGFHLMLTRLKRPLKPGERVRVTLTFERAGRQTVQADVRGL